MEHWEENLDVVHGKRNRLDLRIDHFVFWIFNFNQPWKPEIRFYLKIILRYKLSQRSGFTILGYFYGHKIPTLIIQLNLWVLASFGAVGAVVKVSFDLCNAKQHNMSLNPNVFWRRGPGYWNIIRFSRDQKKSGKWMKDFWWKFLKLLSLPVVVIYVSTIQFLYSWSRLFFGIIAVASSV